MGKRSAAAGCFLLSTTVLVACHQGGSPTEPGSVHEGSAIQAVRGSARSKTDICHLHGDGSVDVINVADASVPAHLAHGDHLVTAEVCGDGIDNDCDGQVDEDCTAATCPCEDQASISSLRLGSSDPCTQSGDVVSFGSGGFSGPLATSSVESGNTQCTWKIGPVTVATSSGHSNGEALACHDAILQHAASLGVSCS